MRTPRFDEKYFRSEKKWHLDRNEHNDHSSEFKQLMNKFARSFKGSDFSEYPNLSNGYVAISQIFGLKPQDVGRRNLFSFGDEATITLANGSDEALKSVFYHFRNKKTISIVDPTYQAATVYTKMFGYKINSFPYTFDEGNCRFDFDIHKFCDASNVLYIASPDNITGSKLTEDQLDILLKSARDGKIVIFDYAYSLEYNHLLHNKKNVIMVGTLSKFYAGAFLRIGYISASCDVTEAMYENKTSYEITGPAVKYLEFVANHLEYYYRSFQRIQEGKSLINKAFNNPIKTETNFCLIPYKKDIEILLEQSSIIKCPTIDRRKFIRIAAADPKTVRKILRGEPKEI